MQHAGQRSGRDARVSSGPIPFRGLRAATVLDWLAFAAPPFCLHECVAWQSLVHHLARRFGTGDGEAVGIELADLYQNRGLIPVDMLVHQLVTTEPYDCD